MAGELGRTLLAECPSVLLEYFSTKEARHLRLVCREFKVAVANNAWADKKPIKGSIVLWRNCFPCAVHANVSLFGRRNPVLVGDFVHLTGLRSVDMSGYPSIMSLVIPPERTSKIQDTRYPLATIASARGEGLNVVTTPLAAGKACATCGGRAVPAYRGPDGTPYCSDACSQ